MNVAARTGPEQTSKGTPITTSRQRFQNGKAGCGTTEAAPTVALETI
jgi:hypothetical protein